MSATHTTESNAPNAPRLCISFELSHGTWKLAFTTGAGQSPRLRTIPARYTNVVLQEIGKAKKRFGLPQDAQVICCYEAGRDGFWLHRFLTHAGIQNLVVDSASIEVNRRKRRAKSDRLDAIMLVSMLVRWRDGEKKVWRVARAPSVADEDRRQLHRELIELKTQRTEHTNRIRGLLAALGLTITVDQKLPERLERLRQWDGTGVPATLKQQLLREYERWQLVGRQIKDIEATRTQQIRTDSSLPVKQTRQLMRLKGMGRNGAWLLCHEFFGWRDIKNRRQVGSLSGLAPTPYASGQLQREQGISKAGNRRVRWMMIELAWMWLRYQPGSELSQWFQRRFGSGSSRIRKIGIVALARKLLIELWKYLQSDQPPAGAELKETKSLRLKPAG
jgi:transposase